MIPAARQAGHAMALAALAVAFAAAAQAPIYDPAPRSGGGGLAWLFAAFVLVAVAGVFLVVLWLVKGPAPRQPGMPPPGATRPR